MRRVQSDLVAELEQKSASAPDVASDEYMYQDRAEAELELTAAKRLLGELPITISGESLDERIWNQMPYERYRD